MPAGLDELKFLVFQVTCMCLINYWVGNSVWGLIEEWQNVTTPFWLSLVTYTTVGFAVTTIFTRSSEFLHKRWVEK